MAGKKKKPVAPNTKRDDTCANRKTLFTPTVGQAKLDVKDIPLLVVSLQDESGTQGSNDTINHDAVMEVLLIAASAGVKPRFDRWEKLLHRFYEPLVLLYTLDKTRGAHLQRPTLDRSRSSELRNGELRRTLLDKLSYICDFDNGGKTVAAIALERRPDTIVYRVAANKNVQAKARTFLKSILSQLRDCSALSPQESTLLQENIAAQCVTFSEKRLRTYHRFLQTSLKPCRQALINSGKERGQ